MQCTLSHRGVLQRKRAIFHEFISSWQQNEKRRTVHRRKNLDATAVKSKISLSPSTVKFSQDSGALKSSLSIGIIEVFHGPKEYVLIIAFANHEIYT